MESGQFVNRGFLNGPVCPIYGVGVLAVIGLLQPVKDNIFLMFAGAVIITSTVELLGGFILEKIFHDRWWDYSDMPFNIGGYICLMFSLVWGLACLVVVDRIHPLIGAWLDWIPLALSQALLILFGITLLIDTIATVKSVLNLNRRLEVIDEISARIREASDLFGENLASGALTVVHTGAGLEESLGAQIALMEARRVRLEQLLGAQKENLEADLAGIRMLPRKAMDYPRETLARQKQLLQELLHYYRDLQETRLFGHKRLFKAFPGLQSRQHSESLDRLRKAVLQGFKPASPPSGGFAQTDETDIATEPEANSGTGSSAKPG